MGTEIITTPERSQLMARVRQQGTSTENTTQQIPHYMALEMRARQAHDLAFLMKKKYPVMGYGTDIVRCVDLLSGCGGLSLGAMEACRILGKKFLPVAAVDFNSVALEVYKSNFKNAKIYQSDINDIIDGEMGADPTTNERKFLDQVMPIKICMSGPPCKGHSDLNNHTRRKDDKNKLYLKVARFIEIAKPEYVIVENVPAVTLSTGSEVLQSKEILRGLGYHVDDEVVDLSRLGVPQKRKRHILIGSLHKKIKINDVVNKNKVDRVRTINWAIKDLADVDVNTLYDRPSRHSKENMDRIRYLHENKLYDLPDHLRPLCHQSGDHSYKSMYGRMKPNEPAQTITSGFGSPGQGRFIHPTRLSTITAHEAARLQYFPDFFDFSTVKKKTQLAEMIGNAAPWILSYIFCIEFLS